MPPGLYMFAGSHYPDVASNKRRRATRKPQIPPKSGLQQDQEETNSDVAAQHQETETADDGLASASSDQPTTRSNNVCPYCFMETCVATMPSDWLGPGQPACDANSGVRKTMYKRYWQLIDNLGGWNLHLYLAKKQLRGDVGLVHKRQIMPECVVEKVRQLYPNPDIIANYYMTITYYKFNEIYNQHNNPQYFN